MVWFGLNQGALLMIDVTFQVGFHSKLNIHNISVIDNKQYVFNHIFMTYLRESYRCICENVLVLIVPTYNALSTTMSLFHPGNNIKLFYVVTSWITCHMMHISMRLMQKHVLYNLHAHSLTCVCVCSNFN